MADKLTPEQRHRCMSRIRSKDTKPELIVRRFLFSNGYRYRIHEGRLPGKPDIVLKKYRAVIFVNGCFWHGHNNCKLHTLPQTHTDFWQLKITRNIQRDISTAAKLKEMGWHVIRIWECQLSAKQRANTLDSLLYTLNRLALVNLGAKVMTDYEQNEDDTPVAAED